MPVYQQTERTVAEVTVIKRLTAKNAAEAEELFDDGNGYVIEETSGNIHTTLETNVERMPKGTLEKPSKLTLELDFFGYQPGDDEVYASELARIAGMIGEGYREGEILIEDDNDKQHRGWWKVARP